MNYIHFLVIHTHTHTISKDASCCLTLAKALSNDTSVQESHRGPYWALQCGILFMTGGFEVGLSPGAEIIDYGAAYQQQQ